MSDFPKPTYLRRGHGPLTPAQLRQLDLLLSQLWLDEYSVADPTTTSAQINEAARISAVVRTVRDLARGRAAAIRRETKARGGLSVSMAIGLRYLADPSASVTAPNTGTVVALIDRGLVTRGTHELTDAGREALRKLDGGQ